MLKQTLEDLIAYWADASPEAAVLHGPGKSPLTYRELGTIVAETRGVLRNNGFGRNDRIAIVHSGGAEMAAAVAAIASSAPVVPLNPNLTAGEFSLNLHDKKARAVAIEAGLSSPARAAARKLCLPVFEIRHADTAIAGRIVLEGGDLSASASQDGPAEPDDILLVLTTSGTTSYGKIVPIRQRQAVMRSRHITDMLELRPTDIGLNMMPLFHVGGLSAGLMSCIFSGSSMVPIKNGNVRAMFDAFEEFRPSYIAAGYTTFHTIEKKAVEYSAIIERAKPHIRMLRTGAGHLDVNVADRLEAIFDAPVVEAYGSSETGFMACKAIPPKPRKRGSVGQPKKESVTILDGEGKPVASMEKGEVAVRGACMFDGYENDLAANQKAFSNGWYLTGDEGYLDEDGFLFLTGRIKEMINRGGLKIAPAEVDEAIARHPAVHEAASFPVAHPTLGQDVCAAVVLEKGSRLSAPELSKFLRKFLAPNKIPSRVFFVAEIPKNATGKIQRLKLPELLDPEDHETVGPAGNGSNVVALSPMERELQAIWQKVLGRDQIHVEDNFFALGGDSLQAVDLFLLIEKALHRRLPRDILFEAGTIADMARLIEEGAPQSCIVPIKPEGSRTPFFCVHPIGGEALGYRDLAECLDADQPFYGIQQFQPDTGTSHFSSVEEMAEYYLTEIRKIQPGGPYNLGGHSFGGLVAYVIAQKLHALGEKTTLLALFDTYIPEGDRYISPLLWLKRHYHVYADLPGSEKLGYLAQRIRNLSKGLFRSVKLKLLAFLNKGNAVPAKPGTLRPNIADINALNIRKLNLTPYEGNAVLFVTELPMSFHPDVHDNWGKFIRGKLKILEISGGHVGIMQKPNVEELARELTKCLNELNNTEWSADKIQFTAGAGR